MSLLPQGMDPLERLKVVIRAQDEHIRGQDGRILELTHQLQTAQQQYKIDIEDRMVALQNQLVAAEQAREQSIANERELEAVKAVLRDYGIHTASVALDVKRYIESLHEQIVQLETALAAAQQKSYEAAQSQYVSQGLAELGSPAQPQPQQPPPPVANSFVHVGTPRKDMQSISINARSGMSMNMENEERLRMEVERLQHELTRVSSELDTAREKLSKNAVVSFSVEKPQTETAVNMVNRKELAESQKKVQTLTKHINELEVEHTELVGRLNGENAALREQVELLQKENRSMAVKMRNSALGDSRSYKIEAKELTKELHSLVENRKMLVPGDSILRENKASYSLIDCVMMMKDIVVGIVNERDLAEQSNTQKRVQNPARISYEKLKGSLELTQKVINEATDKLITYKENSISKHSNANTGMSISDAMMLAEKLQQIIAQLQSHSEYQKSIADVVSTINDGLQKQLSACAQICQKLGISPGKTSSSLSPFFPENTSKTIIRLLAYIKTLTARLTTQKYPSTRTAEGAIITSLTTENEMLLKELRIERDQRWKRDMEPSSILGLYMKEFEDVVSIRKKLETENETLHAENIRIVSAAKESMEQYVREKKQSTEEARTYMEHISKLVEENTMLREEIENFKKDNNTLPKRSGNFDELMQFKLPDETQPSLTDTIKEISLTFTNILNSSKETELQLHDMLDTMQVRNISNENNPVLTDRRQSPQLTQSTVDTITATATIIEDFNAFLQSYTQNITTNTSNEPRILPSSALVITKEGLVNTDVYVKIYDALNKEREKLAQLCQKMDDSLKTTNLMADSTKVEYQKVIELINKMSSTLAAADSYSLQVSRKLKDWVAQQQSLSEPLYNSQASMSVSAVSSAVRNSRDQNSAQVKTLKAEVKRLEAALRVEQVRNATTTDNLKYNKLAELTEMKKTLKQKDNIIIRKDAEIKGMREEFSKQLRGLNADLASANREKRILRQQLKKMLVKQVQEQGTGNDNNNINDNETDIDSFMDGDALSSSSLMPDVGNKGTNNGRRRKQGSLIIEGDAEGESNFPISHQIYSGIVNDHDSVNTSDYNMSSFNNISSENENKPADEQGNE